MATIFSKKSPSPNTNGGGIEREGDKPLRAQPLSGTEKAHGQAYRMDGIEVPSGIFRKIPLLRG